MTDDLRAIREAVDRGVSSVSMALALLAEVDRLRAQLATARRDAWRAGRDAGARRDGWNECRAAALEVVRGCDSTEVAERWVFGKILEAIAALEPPGDK